MEPRKTYHHTKEEDVEIEAQGSVFGSTSPLSFACLHKHNMIVAQLIASGADVNFLNEKGYSPLFFAILGSNIVGVDMLLQAGALQIVPGQCVKPETKAVVEPIHFAKIMGEYDIVKLLAAHQLTQTLKETDAKFKIKDWTASCRDKSGKVFEDGHIRMFARRNSHGELRAAEDLNKDKAMATMDLECRLG